MKTSLKLSRDEMQALETWIQHCLGNTGSRNAVQQLTSLCLLPVYQRLHQHILMPNSVVLVKLRPHESLALAMSLQLWDVFSIPTYTASVLLSISTSKLPRLAAIESNHPSNDEEE